MWVFETLMYKFKRLSITLLISLTFCVLFYIFDFFTVSTASCETGFLTRSIVYGKPYLHSPSINSHRVQLLHEQLHYFLSNSYKEQFNFNIYKYVKLDGLLLPKKHPYNHPNLHLYVNDYVEQVLHIHVNIQMSHQFNSNFEVFTCYDINGKGRTQYINNITSLYDSNEVSPILFGDEEFRLKYLKINFDNIIKHYKYMC